MSNAKLEVQNLTLKYGDALAVDNVSFSIAHGECLTILGANGAGKSSIGKSLAGLLPPASGNIILDGDDVTNLEPYLISQRKLSYLPEGRAIFPTLTVEENLMLGARKLSADRSAQAAGTHPLRWRAADVGGFKGAHFRSRGHRR